MFLFVYLAASSFTAAGQCRDLFDNTQDPFNVMVQCEYGLGLVMIYANEILLTIYMLNLFGKNKFPFITSRHCDRGQVFKNEDTFIQHNQCHDCW